jgi:hypothetical protein
MAAAGGVKAVAAPRPPRADPDRPFTLFGRRLGVGAWLGAMAASVGVLVLRRTDGLLHPKLFAEDGPIFLRDAYVRSLPGSVFQPYNGYLHVVLRLWAELTTLLPARYLALSYTVFALGTTALCYGLVLSRRLRWLLPSDGLRVVALIALLVLPGSSEILGTLTNTLWPMGVALVLLSLSDAPRTVAGRRGELAGLFALGMTGANSLLVWPAFLIRWRRGGRQAHDLAAFGLITACAVAQGLIVALSGQRTGAGLRLDHPADIVDAVFVRVWGTLTMGERLLAGTLPRATPAAVWVVCGVALALTVAALVATPASFRIAFVVTFALSYGATVWGFDGRMYQLAHSVDAGRYFVAPMALVLLAWLAALDRVARGRRPPVRALAAVLPLGLLAFGAAQDFVLPHEPAIHWGHTAACIVRHQVCEVPMNPPNFTFNLPPVPGAY